MVKVFFLKFSALRYRNVVSDCDGLFSFTHYCKTGQLFSKTVSEQVLEDKVNPFVKTKDLAGRSGCPETTVARRHKRRKVQMIKTIGPFNYPVTWYKITHAGEQAARWDIQTNATRTSPPGLAFVLEVPPRNLLTSM